MAKAPEALQVVFTEDDIGEMVEHMARLTALGHGWINLDPLLDVEDIPEPPSGLTALFTAKGPPIPRATWIAPIRKRRRSEPGTIGMEHGRGRRALPFLADADIHRDASWRTLSDSAKRGLVIALPPESDERDVLTWLLAAANALSTAPLAGRWRGSIYDS
jgi:hypothetical protein